MDSETQEMLFGRVVFSRPVTYEKPDFIVRYEERHKEFNRMNEFYVLKDKLMKRRIRTIKNP